MLSRVPKLLPVNKCVQYTVVERCRRGCTSSLYITGDRATESCAVLTPYIDLDIRLKDEKMLMKNIKSRGMAINIHELQSGWNKFQTLKKYRMELARDLQANNLKIKTALEQDSKKINELKTESARVAAKLKIATTELWALEKSAIIGGLSLPNDINSETPDNNCEKIVHEFGRKPDSVKSNPSHLEIADKLSLIEYYDSSYYFLKGDAAHFEMGICYMFMDRLKDCGFISMSNSDFGRSLVVEGVGLDPRDASAVFTLERETNSKDPLARLHLVGGASLVSFSSYHTKTITNTKYLPLRYVTLGRHYNPSDTKGMPGLFSTWQSSAVETFAMTADEGTALTEFKSCVDEIVALYESLGYHFRVQYLSPIHLSPWESLRASFQMFSRNLNCYIEVGSLSLCDDYISRRLLICCETSDTVNQPLEFTQVISGTIVSVPRLLGCVLEYDCDGFKVPELVRAAVM